MNVDKTSPSRFFVLFFVLLKRITSAHSDIRTSVHQQCGRVFLFPLKSSLGL